MKLSIGDILTYYCVGTKLTFRIKDIDNHLFTLEIVNSTGFIIITSDWIVNHMEKPEGLNTPLYKLLNN